MHQYNPHQYDSVFNEWAQVYDKTVTGSEGEYSEVFAGYANILEKVSGMIDLPAGSLVLDLGTGTGNLAMSAARKGYQVIGIDPNQSMLEIARAKYPDLSFSKGDFFNLPELPKQCSALISSYAFHHLTDIEKERAASLYFKVLASHGKVVFADTVFLSAASRQAIVRDAVSKGYKRLVEDLNSEHYTTHINLVSIFTRAGFNVAFKQMNKFVWIMLAIKK